MDTPSESQIVRFKQGLQVARRRLERALNVYEAERDQFEITNARDLEEEDLFNVFELVTSTFDQIRRQVQQLQALDLQWRRLIQNLPEQARITLTEEHESFIADYHDAEQNGEQVVSNILRVLPELRTAAASKLGIDLSELDDPADRTLHGISSSAFTASRPQTPVAQILQPDNQYNLQPTQSWEPSKIAPVQQPLMNLNATDLLYLPKVKIPDFDGDASAWIDFWDLFSAMVDQRNLDPCIKLFMLRTHLRGDAAMAIAKIGNSNADYAIAVRILKELFGDPLQVQHRLRAQIIHYVVSENNPTALYRAWAHLSQLYSQLVSSGDVVDNTLMGQILESKFPRFIIQKIHRPGVPAPTSAMEVLATIGSVLKAEANVDQLVSDNKATFKQAKKPAIPPLKHKQWNLTHVAVDEDNSHEAKNCGLCDGSHLAFKCPKFEKPAQRFSRAKERHLCFNCLRSGHGRQDCSSDKRCKHCDGLHHSTMCLKSDTSYLCEREKAPKFKKKVTFKMNNGKNAQFDFKRREQTTAIVNEENYEGVHLAVSPTVKKTTTLLMTAEAKICNQKIPTLTAYKTVFVDAGSTKSYISSELASELKLKPISEEKLTINTFGDQSITDEKAKLYEILVAPINGTHNKPVKIQAIARPKLTIDLLMGEHQEMWSPTLPTKPVRPHVLIGMDYYDKIIIQEDAATLPSGFKIRQTNLGAMIAGVGRAKIVDQKSPLKVYYTYSNMDKQDSFENSAQVENRILNEQLQNFWSIEHLGITDDPFANDDELALRAFNASITKDESGRYSCGFPWKVANPRLPSNFQRALGCLQSTIRRLQANFELFEKYDANFQEQLSLQMIEIVTKGQIDGPVVHYIPHHPVVTNKLRIVFNASAKTAIGKSLNDLLYRGPVILPQLLGILLRFRASPVPLLGDLEKAFLQVSLRLQDRDCTRFLWIRDIKKPLSTENLIVFRYKRVPFGFISSPFLLAATVNHHLHNYLHPIAQDILNNVYVDNVLMNCQSGKEAIEAYKMSREIFTSGHMNLRDFVSHEPEVKQFLAKEGFLVPEEAKVLGVKWQTVTDEILINTAPKTKINGKSLCKREVLSQIASVFDPLGVASPLMVGAKIFMQELWRTGHEWDNSLSDSNIVKWNILKQELDNASPLRIKRKLELVEKKTYHLHIFADASKDAYAAVAYLQDEKANCPIFLMGKTRVAPLKRLSIPRMELLAVTIAAALATTIKDELSQIQIQSLTIWSDSMIVLNWLRTNKILPTFVKNRILNIWQKVPKANFKYVPTNNNPADCATREINAHDFKNSMWLAGPEWLSNEENWPIQPTLAQCLLEPEDPEENCELTASVTNQVAFQAKEAIVDFSRFSSWSLIVRTIIAVFTFIGKCFQVIDADKNHWLTKYGKSISFLQAEQILFHQIQSEIPPTKSTIQNLNLFLDSNFLYRCNTRLTHSNLHETTINPIYLPEKSHGTQLYILYVHKLLNHAPKATLVSTLRINVWIPKLRSIANRVINNWCFNCKNPKPFHLPDFPSLPRSRVLKQNPFESCGLDYAGPMLIKVTKKEQSKMWICLFCCLTSRAIHLEPVYDLSTISFLQAFRRFVSRRGIPSKLYSDNATTFKSASKVLMQAWKQHEDVQFYLESRGIEWSFIVEGAPWQGGSWERMIGITKNSLRRMIGRKILSLPEMNTILTEVEALVNSRPLIYVPAGEFGEVIRPIDCISPGMQIGVPILYQENGDDEEYNPKPTATDNLISLWQKQQKLLNNFWISWEKQYLTNLIEHSNWSHKQGRSTIKRAPQKGEVVLLPVGEKKRGEWKLAKVLSVLKPSRVRLQLISGKNNRKTILERSPKAICPLEVSGLNIETMENENEEIISNNDQIDDSPTEAPALVENNTVRRSERLKNKPLRTFTEYMTIISIFTLCIPMINAQVAPPGYVLKTESNSKCTTNGCCDKNEACQFWATNNECLNNPNYMIANCPLSCHACPSPSYLPVSTSPSNGCSPDNCAPWRFECCTYSQKSGMILWIVIILLIFPSILTLALLGCQIFKLLIRTVRLIYQMCCRRVRNNQAEEGRDKERIRQFRRLSSILTLAMILNFPLTVNGCSEISQLGTEATRCQIDTTTQIKTCWIEKAIALSIHPVGETACLSVSSSDNETLGQLEITTKAIKYYCNYQFWYYTRDYDVDVESVHRCRQASGSQCFDNFCETIQDNTILNDMSQNVKDAPGYSKCARSCQCVTCNGCFLCEPSCLFYRIYAKKASEEVYEIGSCPTWTVGVLVDVTWKAANGISTASMLLVPSTRQKAFNSTMTLLSATIPPFPILSKAFMRTTAKKERAAVISAAAPNQPTTGTIGTMQCQTEEQAKDFKCSFPLSICSCQHDNFKAGCNCGIENPIHFIDEIENKLPLQTGPMTIETDYSASVNQHSGLQLQVDFQNVSVELIEYLVDCNVTAKEEVVGCRSCQSGAIAKVTCQSIVPTTIAVQCTNDVRTFVFSCNNSTQTIVIHTEAEDYISNCSYKCSRSSGQFQLKGKLETVTPRNSIDPQSGDWWSKPAQVEAPFRNIFDAIIDLIGNIIKFAFHNPFIIMFIIIIVALIVYFIVWAVRLYLLPKTLAIRSFARAKAVRKQKPKVP